MADRGPQGGSGGDSGAWHSPRGGHEASGLRQWLPQKLPGLVGAFFPPQVLSGVCGALGEGPRGGTPGEGQEGWPSSSGRSRAGLWLQHLQTSQPWSPGSLDLVVDIYLLGTSPPGRAPGPPGSTRSCPPPLCVGRVSQSWAAAAPRWGSPGSQTPRPPVCVRAGLACWVSRGARGQCRVPGLGLRRPRPPCIWAEALAAGRGAAAQAWARAGRCVPARGQGQADPRRHRWVWEPGPQGWEGRAPAQTAPDLSIPQWSLVLGPLPGVPPPTSQPLSFTKSCHSPPTPFPTPGKPCFTPPDHGKSVSRNESPWGRQRVSAWFLGGEGTWRDAGRPVGQAGVRV